MNEGETSTRLSKLEMSVVRTYLLENREKLRVARRKRKTSRPGQISALERSVARFWNGTPATPQTHAKPSTR